LGLGGILTLCFLFGLLLCLAELLARGSDVAGDLGELASTDQHDKDDHDHVPKIWPENVGDHAGYAP
jgi:hypothetical protein